MLIRSEGNNIVAPPPHVLRNPIKGVKMKRNGQAGYMN